MKQDEPISQFVLCRMPYASPEEIREASRRWFAVIRILARIAQERAAKATSDSPTPPEGATVSDVPPMA